MLAAIAAGLVALHLGWEWSQGGIASHHFCRVCGIHTHTRPRSAPHLYTVNVRVLDDFDLAAARPEVLEFDGRHWEENVARLG